MMCLPVRSFSIFHSALLGMLIATFAPSTAAVAAVETSEIIYERPGPFPVVVERRALCCDSEGHQLDLYRPEAPPTRPLPVITWGNGTWASPEKYDYLLRHFASWGFIVVATHDNSVASGRTILDALDRLLRLKRTCAFASTLSGPRPWVTRRVRVAR
jgi:predicted dienelactone hydrolase